MKIKITVIMKTFICLAVFSLCFTIHGFSQSKANKSEAYITSGGELIFSFANVEQNGNSESSTMRFSPVLNLQVMANKDMNKNFGVFTGLALRNVGYITNNYKDPSINLVYRKSSGLITWRFPLVLKL